MSKVSIGEDEYEVTDLLALDFPDSTRRLLASRNRFLQT